MYDSIGTTVLRTHIVKSFDKYMNILPLRNLWCTLFFGNLSIENNYLHLHFSQRRNCMKGEHHLNSHTLWCTSVNCFPQRLHLHPVLCEHIHQPLQIHICMNTFQPLPGSHCHYDDLDPYGYMYECITTTTEPPALGFHNYRWVPITTAGFP